MYLNDKFRSYKVLFKHFFQENFYKNEKSETILVKPTLNDLVPQSSTGSCTVIPSELPTALHVIVACLSRYMLNLFWTGRK